MRYGVGLLLSGACGLTGCFAPFTRPEDRVPATAVTAYRAVPDDALDEAVDDLIRRSTRGSVLSKSSGKAAFYAHVDLVQCDAYDLAIEAMAQGAVAHDGQEGIASFLEKRPPVWHHH